MFPYQPKPHLVYKKKRNVIFPPFVPNLYPDWWYSQLKNRQYPLSESHMVFDSVG